MRKSLILLLLCLVASAATAQHTLQSVFVRVVLHKDGSASVRELRKVQVGEQGTEGYIAFHNMGDIEVRDLQVADEKGTQYVVEPDWDVDRSRAEKEGRCGYNYTREGVEVCWGLGEAGERKYLIEYTLTNLVKAYEDYDGFNHSFYEAGGSPAQQAAVSIHLEEDSLTREKAAIWTFGYHGTKGFSDGKCYAVSKDAMNRGESIIVLLQLEKGVLDPVVKKEESFTETVKRVALEGSDYNLEDAGLGNNVSSQKSHQARVADVVDEDDYFDYDDDFDILETILVVVGLGFVGFTVLGFLFKVVGGIIYYFIRRIRFSSLLTKLLEGKKYDELPYYRDLPYDGDLLMSGTVLSTIDAFSGFTGKGKLGIKFGLQQLYEAFVLRMLYKNQIELKYEQTDGEPRKHFHISKPVKPPKGKDVTKLMEDSSLKDAELTENKAINADVINRAKRIYNGYINDAGIEYYLQKLLYEAAGEDHLLQPSELKEYVEKDPTNWRPFAIILGVLTTETIKEKDLEKTDVQQVVGFLHYLKDFSLVTERHLEETSLWKEYLVYASLYGIADQVRKDMKKVAPDVARLDSLVPYERIVEDFQPLSTALSDSVIYAYSYISSVERAEIERKRQAEERRREFLRSSGGSGFSSFRGGGGHSGGGGSGFR